MISVRGGGWRLVLPWTEASLASSPTVTPGLGQSSSPHRPGHGGAAGPAGAHVGPGLQSLLLLLLPEEHLPLPALRPGL